MIARFSSFAAVGAVLCLSLATASSLAADEANLVPEGDFAQNTSLSGWSVEQDWMKSSFSRETEGDVTFLRVNKSPAVARIEADIPEGAEAITFVIEARATGVEQGKNAWDIPLAQLGMMKPGEGKPVNNAWKSGIKFRDPTHGWVTQSSTVAVPEGATRAQLILSYKAKSGDWDLRRVAMYDAAKAPEGAAAAPLTEAASPSDSQTASVPTTDLSFLGVVRGDVVEPWDGKTLKLRIKYIQQYTVLENPEQHLNQVVDIHAQRITRSDSDAAVADYQAFLKTLLPGVEQELAVIGSLEGGTLYMVRMPGPLTHPMGKDAPHLRSRLDESTVTEELRIDAENGPYRTFEEGLAAARKDYLDKGIGVRVKIAPGRYQVKKTVLLRDLNDAAKQAPLIIEGDQENAVLITGAELLDPAGWEVVDAAKHIYRREWTKGHGNDPQTGYYSYRNVLHHRLDHMAINGKAIYPRLIDDFEYIDPKGKKYEEQIGLAIEGGAAPVGKTGYVFRGFRNPVEILRPGEFAIAELGPGDPLFDANPHPYPHSLFVRLPEGVDSIAEAKVEIAMCGSAIHLDDKSNVTLRNLDFEMFFGTNRPDRTPRGAVDVNYFSDFHATRNYRIENCHFALDRNCPLNLAWVTGFEIRNSTFNRNPGLAIRTHFVRDGIIENCTFNENHGGGEHIASLEEGRLGGHGTGGFSFNGMNMVVLNCQMNDNFGCGLRSDYGMYDVLFESCEVKGNRDPNRNAVFHEIEFGPATWRNSRIVDNHGNMGLGLLNVHRMTIENTTIANNRGQQLGIYHSPGRGTSTRPLIPAGFDGKSTRVRFVEELRIINSTLVSNGSDPVIAPFRNVGDIKRYLPMMTGDDTGDVMGRDFLADRNTYWNPDTAQVFSIRTGYENDDTTDLAGWQKATGQDEHSVWAKPAFSKE